jgi:hypothetical protein
VRSDIKREWEERRSKREEAYLFVVEGQVGRAAGQPASVVAGAQVGCERGEQGQQDYHSAAHAGPYELQIEIDQ